MSMPHSSNAGTPFARRQFLKALVVPVSGWLNGCSTTRDDAPAIGEIATPNFEAVVTPDLFPQSVASGDPRPDSVVLWTRSEPAKGKSATGPQELELFLQIAEDAAFTRVLELKGNALLSVGAFEDNDYCVKVRVTGLRAGTEYFYRFMQQPEGQGPLLSSRTGRTKTAASSDSETQARFGVTSCQDYIGRYYHAYALATTLDWDFFVHLGDYIYETIGDASFQKADLPKDSARVPLFRTPESALQIDVPRARVNPSADSGSSPEPNGAAPSRRFLAANTLENYRDLYRAVRSDPNLQALHELCPMIAIADDHEFSNDCSGANATYYDGKQDENDVKRRGNADRAWWEYMPLVSEPEQAAYDKAAAFPANVRQYRDFRFGKHLHLVMTDLRRYRADHVIPEDASPARVFATEAQLVELYGAVPERAAPYVDLDADTYSELRQSLRTFVNSNPQTNPAEVTVEDVQGLFHAATLNALIDAFNAANPDAALTAIDVADKKWPRGFAYLDLGKTVKYSALGSRLLLDAEVFSAAAALRYAETSGKSEEVLGETQENWFLETLTQSDATWKVWGNSYTLMPKQVDLTALKDLEASQRRRFLVSGDDWDGFPNRREALLQRLKEVSNLIAVTGDIHSFFAGNARSAGDLPLLEFVIGAISSATFSEVLSSALAELSSSESTALAQYAPLAGLLLQQSNPGMMYQDLFSNGCATLEVEGDELRVTFHRISAELVQHAVLDVALEDTFTSTRFRVRNNRAQLEQLVNGTWRSWDAARRQFV